MKLNPEKTMAKTEHEWQVEYNNQRKNRLEDAVHDYLDDADTSILEFYNDLRDIIVEMNTYHKTFAEKAEGALVLVSGKLKEEKKQNPEFLTEDSKSYSYEANITLEKIKQFQGGVSL
jgi:hydroxylamine reductase (hybrid-cluster protein)